VVPPDDAHPISRVCNYLFTSCLEEAKAFYKKKTHIPKVTRRTILPNEDSCIRYGDDDLEQGGSL
jgi:hypothetical protein